ncbi:MAG: hypothetical protein ACYCQI_08695 [Gammaproteobacteria bacterium]
MTHSYTQVKLEEVKNAEYRKAFLDIVNPLFRTTMVSSDIEWDLLIKAQNKFYHDKITLDQVKEFMTDLKLVSQTKHLQAAKILLNQYIDGKLAIEFSVLAEKMKTFVPKQKTEEKDLLSTTGKNEKEWASLVEKELQQHKQCLPYLDGELKHVSAFFIRLHQHWINYIPANSKNLPRDFEKSKNEFNKLFNLINQVVRLFVMAKGDNTQDKSLDHMIQSLLGALNPYLGEKSKIDSKSISKMLKDSTAICERVISHLNKNADDIKQKMTDAAAPKSSQNEIYKKAVLYIEKWLAIQYSQIKPSFMQKNTLQQMQIYIAARKASDPDWENIYRNLRAQFVIPKLLKEFAKNQTIPLLQPEAKSTEAKIPTFEKRRTSHEKTQARHDFYVNVGDAFNEERIERLPDRLLQSLSTFDAIRLKASVATEMKEIQSSHQTLKTSMSDQDFERTQKMIDELADTESRDRKKTL